MISTVATNEAASITRLKNTNADEIDVPKVITKIAKQDISKLIPLTIKRISVSRLTIAKIRIGIDVRSSNIKQHTEPFAVCSPSGT
jgi:hypothetical protein